MMGETQRQQNLEQENVGQSDPAERAVARAADGVAMFPDGLQRAKGPAEALANQSSRPFRELRSGRWRLRRREFSSRARRMAMVRSVSSATVSPAKPPQARMTFARQAPTAPGTTGMQFSKSKARFSRFWLVMYSRACQRVSQRLRFMTFTFPATAATFGFAKWRTSRGTASGSMMVSASMVTIISPAASERA